MFSVEFGNLATKTRFNGAFVKQKKNTQIRKKKKVWKMREFGNVRDKVKRKGGVTWT